MFADPTDVRDFRRAAARERAAKIRNEAIKALGGRCPKCYIEDDPRDLKIIHITEESKKWSLVVFYRRVAEYPDRDKFARLICNKCRFNEVQASRVATGAKEPKSEGTGEFYWIAGVRVEQKRRRTGVGPNGELVIHPRLEDEVMGPREGNRTRVLN